MIDAQVLKNAVLEGVEKEHVAREDYLKKLLRNGNNTLRAGAVENGDADLEKITLCDNDCLNRLRRMTSVNAQETPEDVSFKHFTAMLTGEQIYENSPRRRIARRRRR